MPGATSPDSLSTYGAPFQNAGAVVNPNTDMDCGFGNRELAAVAGMTQTRVLARVRMTMAGAATPTLVNWSAIWKNATPTAPVLAYSGTTGVFTVTFPTNVSDEVPSNASGYTGPLPLNLLDGFANLRVGNGGTAFDVFVTPTAANVLTVVFFNVAGAQANPTGVDCTVWAF